MIEDKDTDGGSAVVPAIAIARFAIGIALFLGSEPPLRNGAAGAPAARPV